MEQRRLGHSDIVVSALGFGCMGLSEFYGPMRAVDARAAIRRGLECGITHFDTADMYGRGANEELVGDACRSVRRHLVVATKCGVVRANASKRVDGSPRYIAAACDASLRRLRMDHVDLLYLHRVDPAVPIEESVGAMGDLVRHGKARYLGLSKVDAATLLRALRVWRIAAVQMEYSLLAREVEREIVDICQAENISLVAYSPLCKGLLSDRIVSTEQLDAEDVYRRLDRRFHPDAIERRRDWMCALRTLAREQRCSLSQLALAWLLSRGPHVLPIPGMRTPAQVEKNVASANVTLTPSTLVALDALVEAAV